MSSLQSTGLINEPYLRLIDAGPDDSHDGKKLRPEGMCFATQTGKKYLIESFSFQTGKITPFFQQESPNRRVFLAISPDGQWFLYAEFPPQESDLMLVENFR